MMLYFLMSWLPAVSDQCGLAPAQARTASRCCSSAVSADPWCRPGWWIVAGAIAALIGGYVMTLSIAMVFAVFGVVPAWPLLLVLMGSGIAGVMMSIIALGAIFYPPRSASPGSAGQVPCPVGAVLGPLAGGWLIGWLRPASWV